MCVGSRHCHVHSPGEHGLDLRWVSWHSELRWFKYKSKNVHHDSKLKRKRRARQEKRRGHLSSLKDVWGFFFFSFNSPPQLCVFLLLEKCNSLLCGVKLHPAWSCILVVCVGVDEVWKRCLLYFIYSTTKCVCMSVCVCTGSCSDYKAHWCAGDAWIYCVSLINCVQLKHHIWAYSVLSPGWNPHVFISSLPS